MKRKTSRNNLNLLFMLRRNKLAFIASFIMIGFLFIAILAPLIAPYDPLEVNLDEISKAPSLAHPCGTDNKGRDILSRIIYGIRLSLLIGVGATIGAMMIGLVFGIVAGYFGGIFDIIITMLIDLVLSFPSLLLAIAISVILPPGVYTLIIALCTIGWATFARLSRGMFLSLRESQMVEAARALGCSHLRIILKHILPNCISIIIVAISLKGGSVILSEAALSFLGLGRQPPYPTLGSMISLNRIYIYSATWMVIFPGLAIFLLTLSFNILGDFFRDYLDPTFKIS
jgi:ABC-type dipeptide/oligopeptide/nickel transport system permease subunit